MNMKKQYIRPTAQVVLLEMQQIMALSPGAGSGVNGNISASGDSQLSQEYDDFNASEYWGSTVDD